MRYTILFLAAGLILTPINSANATKLKSGVYKNYHHNKHFRISPPKAFDQMKPDKTGLKLTDTKNDVSVKIHGFTIENPDGLSDARLLNRFHSNEFRKSFFDAINGLSNRKVKNHRFLSINNKDVFEFTLVDPDEEINPLRSIIFYEYGKEFRITLEANDYKELRKHAHYIRDVFGMIGIIQPPEERKTEAATEAVEASENEPEGE